MHSGGIKINMKDYETLIFDIKKQIEDLEDIVLEIERKIEMAKANSYEGNGSYSPTWMAKACHAKKMKNIEIARLRNSLSLLAKEQRAQKQKSVNELFLEALKKEMIEEIGFEKTMTLINRANYSLNNGAQK